MTFVKITEQASLHDNLEQKSVRELLEEINEEDRKVPEAVGKAIPQIEKLVTAIVERMQKGGRIFYLGAGTSGRGSACWTPRRSRRPSGCRRRWSSA